jgi:hypothetical protein
LWAALIMFCRLGAAAFQILQFELMVWSMLSGRKPFLSTGAGAGGMQAVAASATPAASNASRLETAGRRAATDGR